jgi:hypothetical protein
MVAHAHPTKKKDLTEMAKSLNLLAGMIPFIERDVLPVMIDGTF